MPQIRFPWVLDLVSPWIMFDPFGRITLHPDDTVRCACLFSMCLCRFSLPPRRHFDSLPCRRPSYDTCVFTWRSDRSFIRDLHTKRVRVEVELNSDLINHRQHGVGPSIPALDDALSLSVGAGLLSGIW